MIDFVIIIFRFIFFIIMVITVISTPSHLNFCSSCFSYPVFFSFAGCPVSLHAGFLFFLHPGCPVFLFILN